MIEESSEIKKIRQIPLIQIKQDQFVISKQAQQFLSEIKNPVGVITIVGKYRTGKSLFLNKVLLNNTDAFKVSPTINSCTKGLWLSSQILKTQTNDGKQLDVLVIDTEGIGAMEETNSYNNKILLFALLLSSYFIYNTVGSIDQNTLNNLNVIVNMAKDIQSKNSNNQNIEDFFPSFLWVVRDFSLNLVSKQGCSMTSKQYLEQALQIQKGSSDMIEGKNKIRRMLKHFFKDRDCSTLVRPVQAQQDLQNLNNIEDNLLRPQFIEQSTSLRTKIIKKVKVKRLKNKNLTGKMFLQLTKFYIEIINNGSIPNFQLSIKHLIRKQSDRAIQSIVKNNKRQIQSKYNTLLSNTQIDNLSESFLNQSINSLTNMKIGTDQDIKQSIKIISQQIKSQITQLRNVNHKNCYIKFVQKFQQLTLTFDKDFKTYNQLHTFIRQCQKQILHQTKQNPLSKQLFVKMFNQWKSQQLQLWGMSNEKRLSQQISKLIKQNKQINEQLRQNKQKNSNQLNNIHNLEKEILMLQAKQSQEKKIQQMEISYLKQDCKQKDQKIEQLTRIIIQKSQQLQNGSQIAVDQTRKIQDQNIALRQLNDEKNYLKKEIDVLRNSLTSRSKDLDEIKVNFKEVTIQLERALQREKVMSNKTKGQLQNKSLQYGELFNKYQISINQVIELSKANKKLQTQLKIQTQNIQKQRGIYGNMFQSFKESIKLEYQSRGQLIESNKNLSSALQLLEQRAQNSQIRQKQLKQYKRFVKNSSCLQCQHCTKFFAASIFGQHLNVCILGPDMHKTQNINFQNQKTNITIRQTLVRESDSKPYTQYVIDIIKGNQKWTVNRKYKAFCELNSALKGAFPGIELSEVSYIVNPHEGTKKSLMIQQRRKLLEKYLNDLSNNALIVKNKIWQDFIQQPSNNIGFESNNKENEKNQIQQSPEEFLRIWNQRNFRKKQASLYKKSMIN